jgi:excisionase family DNA binding protein
VAAQVSPLNPIFVSPVDAAKLVGVSRSRIYELIGAGVLTRRKDGARTLISVAEVLAWGESLPVDSPGDKRTDPLLPTDLQQLAIGRAREPECDYANLYADRLKLLTPTMGAEEGRLRAFEHVVRIYQTRENCNLSAAKAAVLAAITKPKEP